MKTIGIIPARFDSSRFPGKPLKMILNKPMIQWVYEASEKAESISELYVATDNDLIVEAVHNFGGNVIKTKDCSCGTNRAYEASKNINCDIIVNIQGDEPLITKNAIDEIIASFDDKKVYAATLRKKIDNIDDLSDINISKVVTDLNSDALYFSRSPIPMNRDKIAYSSYYKAIGMYGYKKDFLEKYVKLPIGPLEIMEKLEQLRIIENGYKIRVNKTEYDGIGVDIPEHIKKVESILNKRIV